MQVTNAEEVITLGEEASAILLKKLPKKEGDPGIFSVPISVGNSPIYHGMLDLGASISVMPSCVYDEMNLKPLSYTRTAIHLADRSRILPLGKIEDVLVRVGEFTFPTDFYVVSMDDADSLAPIILGRPFMRTAHAVIDVEAGDRRCPEFLNGMQNFLHVAEASKRSNGFMCCPCSAYNNTLVVLFHDKSCVKGF